MYKLGPNSINYPLSIGRQRVTVANRPCLTFGKVRKIDAKGILALFPDFEALLVRTTCTLVPAEACLA